MAYQRMVLQIVFIGCCILCLDCNEVGESASVEKGTDSKHTAAHDTESNTLTSTSTSSILRPNGIIIPSQIRNKRSNSLVNKEQLTDDNVGLDSAVLYSDQIMQNLLKTQSPKPLSYARSNFFLNLLKPRTTRYHSWDEHSLMHFGKRSSDVNNEANKVLVKRSTDYWSPNNVMHFGKKSEPNYQINEVQTSPTSLTNEALHFGIDTVQDIPEEHVENTLDDSEDGDIPLKMTEKKSSDPWHNMMSFGKKSENPWDHSTLHFGKRQDPWHNMMSFGKRFDGDWDHSTLHFGKREDPWHNMMSFGKRSENPWDHNTLHFGKKDEPWHNMMSFGKRFENPWDHNTLHFGKRDEPWHNMMSFGKRYENPWDHNTLHFGKREDPWHNMMSFGKRFENPWDHSTLHFGKRDEPWHNMMSFGKRFENPWDHNTLHFGKKDEPWHNMMSFGKKSEPWHSMMSFGKKSENSWSNNTMMEEKRDDPWHNMMSFGKKSIDDFGDHFTLHFGKREEPWHNMMSFGKKSENFGFDHNTMHFGKKSDPWHNMMSFGKRSDNLWDHNTLHFGKRDEPWHNMMSFGKRSENPWDEHSTLHFGKRTEPWHNIMSFGKRLERTVGDYDLEDFGLQNNPWAEYNAMAFEKRFEPMDHNTLHFGKRFNASLDSKLSETKLMDTSNPKHVQKRSIDALDNHHTMHFGKKSDPWDTHNTMHFGKKSDSSDFDSDMDIDKKSDWDLHNTLHFGKKSSPWDHNTMHFGKREPWDYHNTMHFGKREPWDYHNTLHFGKREPWDYHNTMHFGKREPWDYHNTMHFGKRADSEAFSGIEANKLHHGKMDIVSGIFNHETKDSKEQDIEKEIDSELRDDLEQNKGSVQKRSTEVKENNLKPSIASKSGKKKETEWEAGIANNQDHSETRLLKKGQNDGRSQSGDYHRMDKSITEGLKYIHDIKHEAQKQSNEDSTRNVNANPIRVHENGIGKRSLKSIGDTNRNMYGITVSRTEGSILKPSAVLEEDKENINRNDKLMNEKRAKYRINKRSVDINFKKSRDNEKSENADPNTEQLDDYSKEEFPDTVLHFGKRSLDESDENYPTKLSAQLWSAEDKRFDDLWDNHNTMHFGKKSYPWESHSTMHFGKRNPWDYHNTMHFGKRDPWDYHNTMHFGKRDPWDYHNTMHFGKRDPWDYHNTMHFGKRDPWDYHNTMHFGKRSSNWDHGLMLFGKRNEISDDAVSLRELLSSMLDEEKVKDLLDENTSKQLINDLRLNILSNNPNIINDKEFLESLENLENSITSHLKDNNMDAKTKLDILKSYLRPLLRQILGEQVRQGVEIKSFLPVSEDYSEEDTNGISESSDNENVDDYGKFDDSNDLLPRTIINGESKLPAEQEGINIENILPGSEYVGTFNDYKEKRNSIGKPELKRYFVPFQGPKSIVYPHAWFASQIRRSAFPNSPEYTRSFQLKMAEKKEDPFNSYMHFGR